MFTVILLGGALTALAVGAVALAKIPKPAAAQHQAEPIDPAILTTHLHRSAGEMASP